MVRRKISKGNLKKCSGFNLDIRRRCKRQDDICSIALVGGMAHGRCQYYINKAT